MIINNEQFNKLMDLAELKISYENAVQDDITKALISIERKLLYSSTDSKLSKGNIYAIRLLMCI